MTEPFTNEHAQAIIDEARERLFDAVASLATATIEANGGQITPEMFGDLWASAMYAAVLAMSAGHVALQPDLGASPEYYARDFSARVDKTIDNLREQGLL